METGTGTRKIDQIGKRKFYDSAGRDKRGEMEKLEVHRARRTIEMQELQNDETRVQQLMKGRKDGGARMDG